MRYMKTINEMRIKRKYDIGHGKNNTAYNFVKDKDKIIKVGSDIKYHAIVFSKRPDIFPIVYKVTPNYIVLEKLDTFDIREDLNEMFDIYKKKINMDLMYLNAEFLQLMLKKPEYFEDTIYSYIIERINYIVNEVKNLYKELSLNRNFFDLNPRNFGYDKKGELKALDY